MLAAGAMPLPAPDEATDKARPGGCDEPESLVQRIHELLGALLWGMEEARRIESEVSHLHDENRRLRKALAAQAGSGAYDDTEEGLESSPSAPDGDAAEARGERSPKEAGHQAGLAPPLNPGDERRLFGLLASSHLVLEDSDAQPGPSDSEVSVEATRSEQLTQELQLLSGNSAAESRPTEDAEDDEAKKIAVARPAGQPLPSLPGEAAPAEAAHDPGRGDAMASQESGTLLGSEPRSDDDSIVLVPPNLAGVVVIAPDEQALDLPGAAETGSNEACQVPGSRSDQPSSTLMPLLQPNSWLGAVPEQEPVVQPVTEEDEQVVQTAEPFHTSEADCTPSPSNSGVFQKKTADSAKRLGRMLSRSLQPRRMMTGNLRDPGRSLFADAAAMKEKVKEAISKPEHNVHDLYKQAGCSQAIARHSFFESLTMVIIATQAVWIAVDLEVNSDTDNLLDKPRVFLIVEQVFCAYFTFEWIIRFTAFEVKIDGIRDRWFIFDSILLALMVLETWIMPGYLMVSGEELTANSSGSSFLRMLRLLRLTRAARMARLLRNMPELLVMTKGLVAASRSVFFTLLLLMGVVYIFTIAFRQLTMGLPVGERYFRSVPDGIASLMVKATLPDFSDMVYDFHRQGNLGLALLLLLFIFLASLLLMNMLIGVLVEVVSSVSSREKEDLLVKMVEEKLHKVLKSYGPDENDNQEISRQEFDMLLIKPEAAQAIQDMGVDVINLVDYADFIFHDGRKLPFRRFMEIIIQLRLKNTATVRDIMDMRRYLVGQMSKISRKIDEMHPKRGGDEHAVPTSFASFTSQNSFDIGFHMEGPSKSHKHSKPGSSSDRRSKLAADDLAFKARSSKRQTLVSPSTVGSGPRGERPSITTR